MKVFEIQDGFGLDHLKSATRDVPEPGPGQVLVRVAACSLNYRDLLTVEGVYNPRQPLPLVPLSDGAGRVESTGPGVSRVKEGDRVAGIFAQKWLGGDPAPEVRRSTLGGPLDGMLAEYALLSEEGVVHVPEHLSDEEAACLPCAGVTAWHALMSDRPVKPGDVVLALGTGGVSIFALQFANLAGARVIITSSSDEKLERARDLGAWGTVNYKTEPEWHRRVMEMTDGQGADHVVEVGGAGTLERSFKAARIGGTVSAIGQLSGARTELTVNYIFMKSLHVQGIFVGGRDLFEAMNRAVAQHGMRPVVDRVFPFDQAAEAFKLMKEAGHFGKIVIRV